MKQGIWVAPTGMLTPKELHYDNEEEIRSF